MTSSSKRTTSLQESLFPVNSKRQRQGVGESQDPDMCLQCIDGVAMKIHPIGVYFHYQKFSVKMLRDL